VPLARGLWPRLRQFLGLRRANVVVLQRKLLPGWQLALLRRMAGRLVYDFDDAVFQRGSYCSKSSQSSMRLARFRATIRAADAVIAGNDYLRQYAAAYADPWRIHVVPTCVEPGWYPSAEHHRVGPAVRLAWIGQRSVLPSLGCLRDHLAAAAREFPGLELRVICDAALELPRVHVVARPWSSSTEGAELADADIGISWLPDDSWSQGKCGLKVLQYMAAGLPVIANPVGMNRHMVIHGRTGFLASTPGEWTEAVRRLATAPGLRSEMGEAARQLVREQYSVSRWVPYVADFVAGIGEAVCLPMQPGQPRHKHAA
jgi:glycosyltransferase involved in cell wall biosynthesis